MPSGGRAARVPRHAPATRHAVATVPPSITYSVSVIAPAPRRDSEREELAGDAYGHDSLQAVGLQRDRLARIVVLRDGFGLPACDGRAAVMRAVFVDTSAPSPKQRPTALASVVSAAK